MPAIVVPPVYVLDQFFQYFEVLKMFGLKKSMYLSQKTHRSFVFGTQGLVQYRDEESMATMFFVQSVISQFSDMKNVLFRKRPSNSKMKQRSSFNNFMFEKWLNVSLKMCFYNYDRFDQSFPPDSTPLVTRVRSNRQREPYKTRKTGFYFKEYIQQETPRTKYMKVDGWLIANT